mmetsp:Transcript_14707/g.25440  ORF Transcript_14707/g.25440 Transcript_14707/m.25440 type:complete len:302 (+) Transcript_14707:907-1812(+)
MVILHSAIDNLVHAHKLKTVGSTFWHICVAGTLAVVAVLPWEMSLMVLTTRAQETFWRRNRRVSEYVPAEGKLLLLARISLMCDRKVGIDFGKRHVQIEVVRKNDARNQHYKDGQRGILKVSELDIHGAELDAPSDIRIQRRRFEPHTVPVGALNVFKVVHVLGIVQIDLFTVNDERVANEQVSHMASQQFVHPFGTQLFVRFAIDLERNIVVQGAVHFRAVGNETADRIVARLGNEPISLLFGTVIHGFGDYMPSHVGIQEVAPLNGCAGGQGEEDGSKHGELIVQQPAFVDIPRLYGNL